MKYFHPRKIWRVTKEALHDLFWYYLLPDSLYLRIRYKEVFGEPLNLGNPQTFNEKIQWLKLNDRKEIYHHLIDKYEVKQILSSVIGEQYFIPTLGVWDRFEAIDFSRLPDKFVLKCTHDAASVTVVKDKVTFRPNDIKWKYDYFLGRDYYHYESKQWAYGGIKPRIIAEQFMGDDITGDLPDYKFYCFNGKVKCIFVGRERFINEKGVLVNLYDRDWNRLPFEHYHPNCPTEFERPHNLEKMISLAEKIACYVNNSFTRIDLYDIKGKIYFGEVTFYPGGGFEEFRPKEWDKILGSWIDLNRGAK